MGLIYNNSTWFFRILVDFENCTISLAGKTRGRPRSFEAISDLFRQFWYFEIFERYNHNLRFFKLWGRLRSSEAAWGRPLRSSVVVPRSRSSWGQTTWFFYGFNGFITVFNQIEADWGHFSRLPRGRPEAGGQPQAQGRAVSVGS